MKINILTQSTDIPDSISGTYPPTSEQLQSAGWRDMPEVPAVPDGYTRLSIVAVEGDGINGEWQITDRLTADIESEWQAAKSPALKAVENQFLIICDQLTGTNTHTKLGFDQLQGIITGMMQSNQAQAVALSLQLLTIDAAGKREGGLKWWDDATWHRDLVDP